MRELLIEYAQQGEGMSDDLMQEVVSWHQGKAAHTEFEKTFLHIVCLRSYPVADDPVRFERDIHPWLTLHTGNGGHWTYKATHKSRQVIIDPHQRNWDWAHYRDCLGFKRAPDAMLFKLTYDIGR
jgi:hypothetical protein